MDEEFDMDRVRAIEEMTYQTANAVETLVQVLIDKGMITEKELVDKMDELAGGEDIEELGHDADAPREADEPDK